MKKISIAFLLFGAFMANAQDAQKDSIINSLKEIVEAHTMKFDGLEERLSASDAILNELAKIKVSGYVQAQYEMYDMWSADGSVHGTGTPLVTNSFFLRRARVKFTYKALDGVKFVLCPNFDVNRVTLKDAFVQLNDRWLNTFSLTVGQFNRPTYEVEFSSSTREFAERSLMTRTLYPSERDQGAKLEADFDFKFNVPLKLQFAVLNGNFGEGAIDNQAKDVDNGKDIMARAVYSLKFPSKGLGIDFGGHTYLGNTTILAQSTPIPVYSDVNNNLFTPKAGDKLKKQLFGAEMQAYYDFLGGLSLKGEYIRGTFSGSTNTAEANSLFKANKVRNVEGFYLSLIKNVGKNNVASMRFDSFDPNAKLSGDAITSKDDLKYKNWSFAWEYFFDANVKIMACYVLPTNEKSQNAGADFKTDARDNTFTLRLQASF
jgi:hypothetical protein